MKLKHQGINTNRLKKEADNPREVAFAQMWEKWQRNGWLGESVPLAWILKDWADDPSEYYAPEPSQRDATVAATVVQWFGTVVGVSFLADVINASPELKEYLRHCCFSADEVKRLEK